MDISGHAFLIPGACALLVVVIAVFVLRDRFFVRQGMNRRTEILFICATVLALSLVIYGSFLFGNYRYGYCDVGRDTLNQYIPFYENLVRHIREGKLSWWMPNFGLGSSLLVDQEWLFDPFNLILVPIVLICGDASLSTALVCAQIARMLCCGILFDLLIGYYCKLPGVRILGSCLYALNGFITLWGQHYWYGTVCVLLALALLMYERLLQQATPPRIATCGLAVSLLFFWSFYCSYMAMALCVVYCVLRAIALAEGGVKVVLLRLLPAVLVTIAGVLMAAFVLLPVGEILLVESNRVTGSSQSMVDKVLATLVRFSSPLEIYEASLRLMGNSFCMTYDGEVQVFCSTNYYELVEVGLSAGIYVLLSMLWACRTSFSKKNRVLMYIAALLVIFYCVNDFIPTLLYAMAYKAYRSSFVLVIPLCLAMMVGLESWLNSKRPIAVVHVGFGITVLLLGILCCKGTGKGRIESLLCIALLAVLYGCVIVLSRNKGGGVACVLICGLLLTSVLVDDYLACNSRGKLTSETFARAQDEQSDADTMRALEYIRMNDDGTYRVEKTYTDWSPSHNDALIQDYQGIAYYNSIVDQDIDAFFENLWPGAICAYAHVYPELDMNQQGNFTYLGVKYILSKSDLDLSWLEKEQTFGDVTLYRNKAFASFGTLYHSSITDSDVVEHPERWKGIEEQVIVANGNESVLALQTTQNAPNEQIDLHWVRDDVLEGTLVVDSEAVASLPLPFSAGWDVTLDGISQNTFCTNYGFIGLMVPPGTHSITLMYTPYGMVPGLVGVFAGVGIILILMYWYRPGKGLSKKREAADTAND